MMETSKKLKDICLELIEDRKFKDLIRKAIKESPYLFSRKSY